MAMTKTSIYFAGATALVAGGCLLTRRLISCWKRQEMSKRRELKIDKNQKGKEMFRVYLQEHPMPVDEVNQITSIPFTELVRQLKDKTLPVEKVLLAYQHKAFIVDQSLNCVIEFFMPSLDEINLDGPLAGCPVSLKDNISIKGYESYAGCAYFLTGPVSFDSVPVTVIKSLGGIPFVKTNVPQTMMTVLSSNPINGATLNPHNHEFSAMGSSSGEAALVGAGGSVLGFGTDIGGSIRLPAASCGIVGFKPTSGRLSRKKMFSIAPSSLVPSSWGPLAQDVPTCIAAMRALCESELQIDLDPTVPPLGFNDKLLTETRPMRIGYFLYDGSYRAVPAMERAVLQTKVWLESRGHTLVPWSPPLLGSEWLRLYLISVAADGGDLLTTICRYDAHDIAVRRALVTLDMNPITLALTKFVYKYLYPNPDNMQWLEAAGGIPSVSACLDHVGRMDQFRAALCDSWRAAKLDAVICPVAGFSALPLKPKYGFTGMLSYQNLFNVTNCPAGSVPVTVVSQEDVDKLRNEYPEHRGWHKGVKRLQENSQGLPVGVQCAALPWHDEVCLRLMREVEEARLNA